jgi:pyruvate/2-oxoglutarate dehydrogenase complex dihydrolipoamide dehydrogenase (E3) component
VHSNRQVDLCVIGGGSAGLSVAAGAAQLGARVVLIERDRMGGECLNTGCVPSKALLAAAKAAQAVRDAKYFGVDAEPAIDFKRVHAHVRSVIDAIAPQDSAERFNKLGVEVIRGEARFFDRHTIIVDSHEIRARRAVIATGSEPAVPAITGLDTVPYWTNENIFDNDTLPQHLLIVGAGPVGVEIAQAYRRLGARVTMLERDRALQKDDPELARRLLRHLAAEGVVVREGVKVKAVTRENEVIRLSLEETGQSSELIGSHLLLAAGRKPRTGELRLQAAGIDFDQKGIIVDERLRTRAPGIYAAGDVVDGPRFTHVCSYHAAIIIKNALFRIPAKIDFRSLSWVTYTDPELAQVGMTEEQARKQHGNQIRVVRVSYSSNDRAQTERQTEGTLKLIADRRGRVLGASILGAHAGELALLWVVAIENGLRLRDLAQTMAPYPTWGELDKAAASEFSRPLLSHPLTRFAAWALSRLP